MSLNIKQKYEEYISSRECRSYADEKRAHAVLDASIAMAEAAEAYLEWILDTPTSSALEDYQSGLRLRREYVAAREVVRRLEKQT